MVSSCLLREEEERSLGVFAGSSSAAGCLGFAAAKTNLPRSASALLGLRSVQLREKVPSLRARVPASLHDPLQGVEQHEEAEATTASFSSNFDEHLFFGVSAAFLSPAVSISSSPQRPGNTCASQGRTHFGV